MIFHQNDCIYRISASFFLDYNFLYDVTLTLVIIVANNHSNRNEVAVAQIGKLKYVRISRNTITYAHAVIDGHRRGVSDLRDKYHWSV